MPARLVLVVPIDHRSSSGVVAAYWLAAGVSNACVSMKRVSSGLSDSVARMISFHRSSCQRGTPTRSMRSRRVAGSSSYGAIKWPRPWPEALRTTTLPFCRLNRTYRLAETARQKGGSRARRSSLLSGGKLTFSSWRIGLSSP
jgi:hypothetical protein